jgi:hypothetical protein
VISPLANIRVIYWTFNVCPKAVSNCVFYRQKNIKSLAILMVKNLERVVIYIFCHSYVEVLTKLSSFGVYLIRFWKHLIPLH